MTYNLYQIDAFTDKIFSGNPAAIVPLKTWLPGESLQNIAAENNLAETGFYVPAGDKFEIRWFTPTVEVDLCGHATLAAAHVLFNHENHAGNQINFHSHRSGTLTVTRSENQLTLNFPTDAIREIPLTEAMTAGFNIQPTKAYKGKSDLMFVFENEAQIQTLIPDLSKLIKLDGRGIIVTAPGQETDFVSRFFGPQVGINEDPVTGSAHTTLTPYWSEVLKKTEMTAVQLSARKGYLSCKLLGDRVEISGQARTYLTGQITLD